MQTNNTDVSVIFVNYKTKDLTINAIKSVIEKTEGLNYEIFVVDNNSQDGSAEAIEKEFPDIKVIKNPENKGFGSANNIAIKQSKGKYVLCLNTDTLLVNNAIKIMFDFMENNPKTGICGGILYNSNMQITNSAGPFPCLYLLLWKLGLRNIFKKHYNYISGNNCIPEKVDFIVGADIMFRKSVLDDIGLFDENYFMFFEESDLCYRAKKANYDIKLVKDAKIIHLEGKSTKNLLQKKKMFKKSEFYYFRKHYPDKYIFVKLLYILIFIFQTYIMRAEYGKGILEFILNDCSEKIQ